VPTVRPKTTASTHELVHVTSDADHGAPHTLGQSSLIARFDDEMDVIPLHGKVKDPEAPFVALASATKGETHRRKHVLAPKRAKPRA
jgi:hypothetical protein